MNRRRFLSNSAATILALSVAANTGLFVANADAASNKKTVVKKKIVSKKKTVVKNKFVVDKK